MKLTAAVGSTAGLVGCSIPTIGGIVCSAAAPSAPVAGLSFSSKTDLENFNGGICVNTFLNQREKELLKQGGVAKEKWTQLTEKFKTATGESKGCLAVSWDKQTWKDNRWNGIIRYEWLFSKGNETMVVHGFFNSEETGLNDNWKATYINVQDNSKAWLLWNNNVSNQTDLATKMPKRPAFFSGSDEYWTFNPDYGKKCSGTNCKGSPWKNYFESTWKWHSNQSGSHKFSDWSKNYSNVFDGQLEALKDVVTKEKGTWESF